MTLVTHVSNRLISLGVDCTVVDNEVHISAEPRPIKIKFDEEWNEAYRVYKKARSINFDVDTRTLTHNNSFEVLLTRLSSSSLIVAEQYALSDTAGNTVVIGNASTAFALAFFDSSEYENYFEVRVKRRILNSKITIRRMHNLVWMPITAVYTAKGRKTPTDLKERALRNITSSLFKVAVEQHDCFSVWKPRVRRLRSTYLDEPSDDHSIPRSCYDENAVGYYKVAKASPFPSQSFLAYYHVLEYYFLRVSEVLLHDRLTAMLNKPSFCTNKDTLDKVIATIRGQDARSDETEMLRNVLERFTQEAELIDFIIQFEEKCGEKIYSKKRTVFGELLQVTPIKDHALANAAKVLKHVRNAIVHSSDRYKREDCHIPLSDSETIIEEFIPLVRFFAEKVICGTAS
ncbi:MAG: hypothetical protein WAV95_05020 [Azonexus sp.]